jgi:hypothetical protein
MTAPAATERDPSVLVAEPEQALIVALQQPVAWSGASAPSSAALPPIGLDAHAPDRERYALVAAGRANEFPFASRRSGPTVLGPSLDRRRQSHRAGPGAIAATGQQARGVPTGGSAAPGGSSGSGFAPSFFLAILFTLPGLGHLLSERLRLPSVVWRPVAFVSLLERPG